jgi:hypothetical protein
VTRKFCSSDYLTGAAHEPGRRQVRVFAKRLYPVVIPAIAAARLAVRLIDLPSPFHESFIFSGDSARDASSGCPE